MVNKLYIDTLTEAEISKLEAKLRPGQSSEEGFLGSDEKLKQVIYEDSATLNQLGVTYQQIADTLESLAKNQFNPPAGFRVEVETYRGGQEDPFQDKWNMFPYSNTDFTVTNSDGQVLTFPGLAIKLIRDYQFFEGKGTPYRVDPETAVKVLKLK